MASSTKTQPVKYPGTSGTQPTVTGGKVGKGGGGKTNEGMLANGRGLEKLRANGKSL